MSLSSSDLNNYFDDPTEATKPKNPYYESLFQSFDDYITSITDVVSNELKPNKLNYELVSADAATNKQAKYRIAFFNIDLQSMTSEEE